MGESFQTMLDYRDLTENYVSAPTLVGTPMTDTFFQSPGSTTADEVEVICVGQNNKPAPGNTRGSNPRQLESIAASKKQFNLFYSFNELQVDANTLRFLRSTDPIIQARGRDLLGQQLTAAGRQQKLFREVVLQQIMNGGRVNLRADGEIVVPSINAASGAITDNADTLISVDYGIPNTRRGDCGNVFGVDGGGFWDSADTLMFQQLANAKDAALKAGSQAPTTVWLNKLNAPKLILNTQFKVFASNNNLRNEAVLQGGGVDNLWGFNFKFLEGYWTDAAGTQHPIIPLNGAILTPDGTDWMRKMQGTEDVPTNVGIYDSFEAALSSLKPVVGMFSYAQVQVTPKVKLSLYVGDNFGVGFPDPNVLWFPSVFSS